MAKDNDRFPGVEDQFQQVLGAVFSGTVASAWQVQEFRRFFYAGFYAAMTKVLDPQMTQDEAMEYGNRLCRELEGYFRGLKMRVNPVPQESVIGAYRPTGGGRHVCPMCRSTNMGGEFYMGETVLRCLDCWALFDAPKAKEPVDGK